MAVFAKRKLVPAAPGNTETSGNGNGTGDSGNAEGLSAKDKAQLRRAQVRKAQIQHRQRKANYIKQLELDVVRFRDLISQTERETTGLRRENRSIVTKLKSLGISLPGWKGEQRGAPQLPVPANASEFPPATRQQQPPMRLDLVPGDQQMYDHVNYPPPSAATELFADINIDDLTVTLSIDETLGTPCYHVSSSSSTESRSVGSPATSEGTLALSPEQEAQAINFILSLEHICWDHFRPDNFPTHGHDDGTECGHTLMASTMCMSSAPESVYEARKALKKSPFSSSKAASPVISWQAPSSGAYGLNLQSLLGLASSLVPGDKELTPVQAWFELASQYHIGLLLQPHVLERLNLELRGVVKCLHYGAVMEREAFESVVSRVMGAELASPGLAY